MLTARPDLFNEWDFERNDELGLDIYKMTKGIHQKAWWICSKCESSYDIAISNKVQGQKCSYCAGKRVNHTNSLASLNPTLASEWHPNKNIKTPHEVTYGSNQKAWWVGKCRHEWEAVISSRSRVKGNGCPYCAGQKLLVGFNDMWTTNPEMAKQLLNPEDGYKYMQNSGKRVDWKCLQCEEIIRNKSINQRKVSCPKCADGVSYNEKVVYNVLSQLSVDFKNDTSFKWSNDKRYDFYLPKYKLIIEIHGQQHYEGKGFSGIGGRSQKEEQENDMYKEKLARENGIENYITIDGREGKLEWIKDNIINSELAKKFDMSEIDWIECSQHATKSLVIEICNYWNSNGKPSTTIIAEQFKLSSSTIVGYLKQGKKNGWCDYDAEVERRKAGTYSSKAIVQLDKNGDFIREWKSAVQAETETGIDASSIRHNCIGTNKTAGGYKWVHKEKYENLIKSK